MSDDSEIRSIPGVQPDELRALLGESAEQFGFHEFAYGTEITGPRKAVEDAAAIIAGTALYVDLLCPARDYGKTVFGAIMGGGKTVVSAESCTGGLLGASMTDFPGSSSVYWGGFLVYSNEAKTRLGVSEAVIERYGAVSRQTVESLVSASLLSSSADVAVAVSGVAGPGGGSAEKPVGCVWVACGDRGSDTSSREFRFSGSRSTIRSLSAGACHGAILARVCSPGRRS